MKTHRIGKHTKTEENVVTCVSRGVRLCFFFDFDFREFPYSV